MSGDYDLLVIYDSKPLQQIFPIDNNVNLPCGELLYWFFGSYDLKISKIGRQLTFLYKKCPNSDIGGLPQYM